MRRIILLCVLAVAVVAYAFKPAPQNDNKMPSLVLKDLNGKDIDVQKMIGENKYTVLTFWATWCSPCKKELENMNDLLEDWQKEYGAQVVAISIDDTRNAPKVKPFVEGKKWTFPVLLDVNSDSKRALNFSTVPYTVLVDQDGNIIYKHNGYAEGDELVLEEKFKKK